MVEHGTAAKSETAVMRIRGGRQVSMKELQDHDRKGDCWLCVSGEVLDATAFVDKHPGGVMSIVLEAGRVCTAKFAEYHSSRAWELLQTHPDVKYIGNLSTDAEDGTADVEDSEPMPLELLGRLGGRRALRAIIRDFAGVVLADGELERPLFERVAADFDVWAAVDKEEAFLLHAMGQADFAKALHARYAGRVPELPSKLHARVRGALRQAVRGVCSSDDTIAEVMALAADLMGPASRPNPLDAMFKARAERVVVVGCGPVGHRLLHNLTQAGGRNLAITIFSAEQQPAYDRMMLTTYFGHRSRERLALTSEDMLCGSGVKLIYGEVASIDRPSKTVSFRAWGEPSSIQEVSYDVLVLATGSDCVVPPIPGYSPGLSGIFAYRTIEDVDGILRSASGGARTAAVVGGGLLGLEAAKALSDLSLETCILQRGPFLMDKQLDEQAASMLHAKVSAMGIAVHHSVSILEILHDRGALVGLRVQERGSEPRILTLDVLVFACGIRPRDQLARQCGLEIGSSGGVKIDRQLRSADPSIYAIGEVASVEGQFCDGLWQPGVEHADVLAQNLAGARNARIGDSDLSTKLKLLPFDVASFGASRAFWSQRQFEKQDNDGLLRVVHTDADKGTHCQLIFSCDGRRLLGGLLVGNASDYRRLHGLCLSGADVTDEGLLPKGECDAKRRRMGFRSGEHRQEET
eukprot:CAMPEP_0204126122 /NCGR_PEP_ID=MMETSP0361-20130328/10816_1 /ASSEMBLY_ACC=CAM_ASM_000343 /TAXON_ID=268821 /ORGANISM="Scrippsiella Hangoei, Strain SHTV-5" /LENGTH=691 /DNA_ID=CAMNT_0051077943 /DNA_START=65 /DNA_END=2136 /DNA_ORIENTATION=-